MAEDFKDDEVQFDDDLNDDDTADTAYDGPGGEHEDERRGGGDGRGVAGGGGVIVVEGAVDAFGASTYGSSFQALGKDALRSAICPAITPAERPPE